MTLERTCADSVHPPSAMPPRTALPEGSTRDEVRAWLGLEEQRAAEPVVEHTFPETSRGHVGCVACHCGDVLALHGPIGVSPVIEAQQRAGEEDQSVPGWDHGA